MTESLYALMWEKTLILWTYIAEYLEIARKSVNDACNGLEPWQVAAYTLGITSIAVWLHAVCQSDQPFSTRLKKKFFRIVRKLPGVKQKIEKEIEKTRITLDEMIHKDDEKREFYKFLPDIGMTKQQVMSEVDSYAKMGSIGWREGAVSGTVYGGSMEVEEILGEVFKRFAWSNLLHPDVFPGARKMEAEIVRMVANMFHASSTAAGAVTSGGTESIELACLAYRNRAYALGITEPEIVLPKTGHAAFDKAGELFRIQVRHVAVDPRTGEVDMRAYKRAITANTCMLVGSAPGFPHGIIDPISEIAKLGERYDIPVHVDACLGGFLIAFMEQAGFSLPLFDFRCQGVTSISCDTHKYGYAPKGTSTVLYRSPELMRYQYFCQPDWPGGIYASPTLAGSRSGLNMAFCWATMLHYGRRGYVEQTRKVITAARQIRDGVQRIKGLRLIGKPEVSVIAFAADSFNIYVFNDRMAKLGWNLNALQAPPSVHIACTPHTTLPGVVDRMLRDIEDVATDLIENPVPEPKEGTAAIYGMAASIPDRTLVSEFAFMFLDACYSTDAPKDPKAKGDSAPLLAKKNH